MEALRIRATDLLMDRTVVSRGHQGSLAVSRETTVFLYTGRRRRYRSMRVLWVAGCALTVLLTAAQTYPDLGGAEISKPFQRKISGAVCFTGTGPIAGNAFFNFPTQDRKALSFTIGPSAPGQEKNGEFKGPGTYDNIAILIKPVDGDSISGRGQVVVNDDEHSGNFTFKTAARPKDKDSDDDDDDDSDGSASGTWDCGRKLPH
jgi:hypothetical protein